MTAQEMRELDAWIWFNIFKMVEHKIDKTSDGVDVWERLYLPENISPTLPHDELEKHWRILYIPTFTITAEYAMEVLKKCAEKCNKEDISICLRYGAWNVSQWTKHKIEEEAETLELAICLFAKKLFSNG